MPIAPSPSTNWGSKVPQFKRSVPDTTWSETDEIQALKRDLRRLEDLYLVEFTSRQKLEMHADLARLENKQLKTQLNLRQEQAEGRKGKQFQSAADFMMSTDSLAAWEESKVERAEKERIETEKAAAKAATEKDNEVCRGCLMHNSDIRYRGSLKGKCKADLEDIATLLAISFTSKTTNVLLATAITTRLTEKPELEGDPRFEGLYLSLSRGPAPLNELEPMHSNPPSLAASTSASHPVPLPLQDDVSSVPPHNAPDPIFLLSPFPQ